MSRFVPRFTRLRELADAAWSDVELRALLFIFLFQIALGTVAFSIIEDWSLFNSLYFCVVSLTTVGYGDLTAESTGGRALTMIYLLFGTGLVVTFVSKLASLRMNVRVSRTAARVRDAPTEGDDAG